MFDEVVVAIGVNIDKRGFFPNDKRMDIIRQATAGMEGVTIIQYDNLTIDKCRELGIRGVKSPTYTMVNEYQGLARVYHFDMVRISSSDDLYSIGFDDYTEDEDAFLLFEWTENIDAYLSEGGIFVTISRQSDDECAREITIRVGDGYTV